MNNLINKISKMVIMDPKFNTDIEELTSYEELLH